MIGQIIHARYFANNKLVQIKTHILLTRPMPPATRNGGSIEERDGSSYEGGGSRGEDGSSGENCCPLGRHKKNGCSAENGLAPGSAVPSDDRSVVVLVTITVFSRDAAAAQL